MGRITIFTEDECENSQIVKDILINMDITFTEINLSSHRSEFIRIVFSGRLP